MKVLIIAENFKRGVNAAEKVVGRNLTLPILSNILLQAEKGTVKAFATNLEIGVSCSMRAKVDDGGKIAVPARVLATFLNSVPIQEKITIEIKEQSLTLAYTGNKTVIKGVDAKDFPLIPKPQGECLVELDSQALQLAIQRTIPCASLSETRQELTGIYVEFGKNNVVFAATDSFRLAEASVRLKNEDVHQNYQKFIEKNKFLIVPAKTMQEVVRSIDAKSEKVKIYMGESQIFLDVDGIMYVSRLIDGKYPEYRQVIPKQFSANFTAGREEFLRAVRTASVFSDSKSREVKVEIKSNEKKIKVAAQSVETGENATEIPAQIDMKGAASIAFNSRFLADGLASLSSDTVWVGFNDNFGPVMLREIAKEEKINQDYLHIIMPIRS